MPLAAAQVVDAIATRLRALWPTSVFTSRRWPLTEADLPAWRVTAEDEPVQPAALEGVNQHALLVECAGSVRDTADLDDALHVLAGQAMPLIFAAPIPFGLQLERIDRAMATEGEAAVGVITLSVRATFFVAAADPAITLSA